ncbi:hypothetical protein E5Q_04657 [Mixia osmundae IAM 14324]|uniref:mannan endo-1,4-beta-mannosidase n=1 Tax=Mixia osmundae (strain CBS 9802 / IAM 14324 / JCM 22182 / KY 12970) TaxID=764103 RepID=G7E567_MIXOS|nr:hypothetical protein E5Q_04657 [Mixia osmundae IAM 14324]
MRARALLGVLIVARVVAEHGDTVAHRQNVSSLPRFDRARYQILLGSTAGRVRDNLLSALGIANATSPEDLNLIAVANASASDRRQAATGSVALEASASSVTDLGDLLPTESLDGRVAVKAAHSSSHQIVLSQPKKTANPSARKADRKAQPVTVTRTSTSTLHSTSTITIHVTSTKTKHKHKHATTATSSSKQTPSATSRPASCHKLLSATSTVYGTGDLPKPTSFVQKEQDSSRLTLDGNTYRMMGANIYWLGLEENVQPSPSYPDRSRVLQAMAIMVAMGGNTIRAATLGISSGHPLTAQPEMGSWNEDAYEAIDYAIYAAGQYGIRLVIPLTDNYQYYHGGKYDFIDWETGSTSNSWAFYTDSSVIAAYKAWIKEHLHHVNRYTGVALKDDPAILAWETGNELGAYMNAQGAPPAAWTQAIARYIKSIDKHHLVIDGSDGLVNADGSSIPGLSISEIDIVSDHLYPLNVNLFETDVAAAVTAQKAMLFGEYDWTGQHGGDDLGSFIDAIEAKKYSSELMWSIFGFDGQCCNYVRHGDNYSLYYPNGGDGDMQARALQLSQHWSKMTGRPIPESLVAAACPQPDLPGT